jgi:hypothetical protein
MWYFELFEKLEAEKDEQQSVKMSAYMKDSFLPGYTKAKAERNNETLYQTGCKKSGR